MIDQEFNLKNKTKVTWLTGEDIERFGFWSEIDTKPVEAVEIIVHRNGSVVTWIFYYGGGQPYDGWTNIRDIDDFELRKLVRWTRRDHELY